MAAMAKWRDNHACRGRKASVMNTETLMGLMKSRLSGRARTSASVSNRLQPRGQLESFTQRDPAQRTMFLGLSADAERERSGLGAVVSGAYLHG
jgi:hypothetical protein